MLFFFNQGYQLDVVVDGDSLRDVQGLEYHKRQVEILLVQLEYAVVHFGLIHHVVDETFHQLLGVGLLEQVGYCYFTTLLVLFKQVCHEF